jgi:hypothetical protein
MIPIEEQFAFRTAEGAPTSRMIWQPRLSKPPAQTNSMLFKYYPKEDLIRIVWMIPARELWNQYEKGKMLQSRMIIESIHDFTHNRSRLECREDDDLSEDAIKDIYRAISLSAKEKSVR